MKTILLCTTSDTLLEHWKKSILDVHSNVVVIRSETGLIKSIEQNQNAILVLDCNFFIDIKAYIYSLMDSFKELHILFMDDSPSFQKGKELLSLGIKGYANGRLSSIHLLQALTLINDGKIWLYPEFIQKLIQEASLDSGSAMHEEKKELESLTEKEKQIALLVSKGYSNKSIASKLDIAESTVKVHLRKIFHKLHVTDRLSLALICR